MSDPKTTRRPAPTPTGESAPSIYIYPDVLEELRFNSAWRPDRVAAGILVGTAHRDPNDGALYVIVEGFISGVHLVDTDEFSRHLRTQWKAATAALRYNFEDAEILGWFMGRQDDDAAPDQAEFVLHNSFFAQPWQVGLWLSGSDEPIALRATAKGFQLERIAVVPALASPQPPSLFEPTTEPA